MAGSVRETSPNKWEIRVYLGTDPMTGRPRYKSKTVVATSRRAAQHRADEIASEVRRGDWVGSEMTFGELASRWLDLRKPDWAPGTYVAYETLLRLHAIPLIGKVPIAKLRTMDIDAVHSRARKSLQSTSVRKLHNAIRGVVDQGMRWQLVGVNVADRATVPPCPAVQRATATVDDVTKIIEAVADDSAFATLLHLAASTGARRGELLALTWGRIALDDGNPRIMITHSGVIDEGEVVVKDGTKTHRARVVSLDEDSVTRLRAHRLSQAESSLAVGSPLTDAAFVFSPRPCATVPHNPHAVTRRVARLRNRLDLPPTVCLHGFRHFVGSHLISEGVDVRTVADRLGHSRPSTTLAYYTHQVHESDAHAAEIMGNVIAKRSNPNVAGSG